MSPEIERKRLLVVANRRGTREMDLLLGGFASAKLATMPPEELVEFAALLDETDADLTSWLIGNQTPPEHLPQKLLKDIRAYGPHKAPPQKMG